MKIKDLKPEYKALAIKNQIAQGNEPNEELELDAGNSSGNFWWRATPEGQEFWEAVDDGEEPEIPRQIGRPSYVDNMLHVGYKTAIEPELPLPEIPQPESDIEKDAGINIEALTNRLEADIEFCIENNQDMNTASWGYQEGVLLTPNEAKYLLSLQSRLSAKPELPDWISVDERLPGENEDVWCAKEIGIMRYSCHYSYISKNWYGYGQRYIEEDITHWMPLPKPPLNAIK